MSTLETRLIQIIYLTTQYYLTPIFILGVIGNILNMIVFSQRLLRINGCSWYFISVSFVHLIVLTFGCLIRMIIMLSNLDFSNVSPIFCKIRTYFVFNSYILSRHFLCVISIDRWMITSSNAFLRRQSNPHKARQMIIISTIIWLVINLFIPIGFQSEINNCIPRSDTFYLLMYTIIDLFATLVPFIILILFSILTLRNVLKFNIIKNSNRQVARIHPEMNIPNDISQGISHGRFLQNTFVYQRHKNKDWQLIRLSFIQIIVFILLNICNAGYTLYQFITKTNGKTIEQLIIDSFINSMSSSLVYTHSAITFYLYTLASEEFRKVCLTIYHRIKRQFLAIFQQNFI